MRKFIKLSQMYIEIVNYWIASQAKLAEPKCDTIQYHIYTIYIQLSIWALCKFIFVLLNFQSNDRFHNMLTGQHVIVSLCSHSPSICIMLHLHPQTRTNEILLIPNARRIRRSFPAAPLFFMIMRMNSTRFGILLLHLNTWKNWFWNHVLVAANK